MPPAAKVSENSTSPDESCLNCGATLHGEYCHTCGQRDIDPRASLWHVLGEFIQESLELDGRLPRTLIPFLFRPGFLAREFLEGRRQRYTSPVRLYVFFALIAFFMLARATAAQVDPDNVIMTSDGVELGDDAQTSRSGLQLSLDANDEDDDGRLHFEGADEDVPSALRDLDGMDRASAARMLIGRFFDWAPIAAAGLLFVYAALLKLFFPRTPILTHVVASTHVHSFALLALAIAATTGHSLAAPIAFAVVCLYAGVGLWQTYRQTWWATLLKSVGLLVLYSLFAGLAMAGVALAILFVG